MFVADTQVKGLFQKKGVTGDKWLVKAKQRGINKPVTVTLGRVDVIQIRDARRLARQKLAILAQGINPNTQDKKARATDQYLGITLEQALSEYLNLRQLKPSTLTSYRTRCCAFVCRLASLAPQRNIPSRCLESIPGYSK